PGGSILKLYELLDDINFLKHILVRHEQGATHMAKGYACVTGKPGVVLVTSGPGATNTVTGIADAYMDSIPMVVFTGQVPTKLIGNDAFQEADIIGITRPITKHNFLVRDVKDLALIIRKAFYIASSGRPGPVLVDIPKDVINDVTEFYYPEKIEIRGYKPNYHGHINQTKKAAQMIEKAKKPLLYIGGGVIISNGERELQILAKENGLPVTMTLMGLGAFPGTDPLSLGMLGMHGTYTANMAMQNCDLLVAIGARFDDRVTGNVSKFSPNSYKIHIDIDPTAIDKNVIIDLPIVGDAKHIIAELAAEINNKPKIDDWMQQINKWQTDCPLHYEKDDGKLRTEYIIEKLSEKTDGNAIIVTDVGQHQMWTAQYYKFNYPHTHITSGGLGTMGVSVPAAIGVSFANPNRPVFSISGDGGFQMNIQELITAAAYKCNVKFIIINNNNLGMVRQWQELYYNKIYSFTDLSESNPDFVKIGEAMGITSFSTDKVEEVDDLLEQILDINDRPSLLEFKVEKDDMVFPMVPANGSVNDIIVSKFSANKLV
ncbi:MAG: biosynthetic-type acetolactate synthase large subunit, partial [Bacteroidetes bacterium]|nr:biosynthetic-type acetolactate synthase large subunit [Bacteroidota bacterium]